MKNVKEALGNIWYFIWEDNSIWSWLVNIILAFVLIKFVVYPGLGFLLQTSHPIVAVMSQSMEHDGSFDTWWESAARCPEPCTQAQFYVGYGISLDDFKKFQMSNGFNVADVIAVRGSKIEDLKVGEIVVYWGSEPIPIIHRIISKYEENGKVYVATKGDHNTGLNFNEKKISQERIVGKAVFRVPYVGWIKLGFVKALELIGIRWV